MWLNQVWPDHPLEGMSSPDNLCVASLPTQLNAVCSLVVANCCSTTVFTPSPLSRRIPCNAAVGDVAASIAAALSVRSHGCRGALVLLVA